MTETTAGGRETSLAVAMRWYVLMVMCSTYAIIIADRYVVTTVMEAMRLDLKLNDQGVAFLTGPPLALFYVTLGIPISWLADRSNRRNILAASLLAWSAMTAFCGLSRNYLQFMLARIGVGVGEAGGTPPANSIIADYFPAVRRPMAMTIFALGAPIGAWLGSDLAGWVADHYTWRHAFLALGVPGVLVGLCVFLTIREPKRGTLDAAARTDQPGIFQTIGYLRENKAAFHVVMGGGVCALWGWGLMWFTPTFLQRSYHLTVGQAGAIVGPIHLIAGSAVSVLTAYLLASRRFDNPKAVVTFLGAGVAIATVLSFIAYAVHDLRVTTLMLWLFVPFIYFYIGPAMALLQNLSPPGMRATIIAISLLVANVLNLIIAPQGVGFLSDFFAGPGGPTAGSLQLALLILAPSGFWAVWHYFTAARTIMADQKSAIGEG
jgi:MFS family permease